jgi:hypothetical protein
MDDAPTNEWTEERRPCTDCGVPRHWLWIWGDKRLCDECHEAWVLGSEGEDGLEV